MSENLLFAFALTAFAGLSTGIGSAIGFFSKKTNKAFLSATLGFSAGAMIYVSFVKILLPRELIFPIFPVRCGSKAPVLYQHGRPVRIEYPHTIRNSLLFRVGGDFFNIRRIRYDGDVCTSCLGSTKSYFGKDNRICIGYIAPVFFPLWRPWL